MGMKRDRNDSKNRFCRKAAKRVSITHKDVRDFATDLILPLLTFTFAGRFALKIIAMILLLASAYKITVNQASNKVKKSPKGGVIRYHLRNLRKEVDLEQLENKVNTILQRLACSLLSRRRYEFAVDLVYIPYHGKHQKDKNEIVRSKAKHGTTHFHAYATLYVIVLGMRFTLAVKYVQKKTPMEDVVAFMLDTIHHLDLKPKCLYLDKGFYSIPVIRLLKRRHIPAVMAAPAKGKKKGIKSLLRGRKSRIVSYTVRSGSDSEEVRLAIVCKYSKGKYNRKGAFYFAYVLIDVNLAPQICYEKYRKRFGIETSYRIMNSVRARTTSRSPELRLLYVAIYLILQNAWVYINWSYMRERKQGVQEAKERLTLDSFINLIIEGIKDYLGVVRKVFTVNHAKIDLLNPAVRCVYLGVGTI